MYLQSIKNTQVRAGMSTLISVQLLRDGTNLLTQHTGLCSELQQTCMFAFLWPDVFANYCSSNLLVLLIALFWVFIILQKEIKKEVCSKTRPK